MRLWQTRTQGLQPVSENVLCFQNALCESGNVRHEYLYKIKPCAWLVFSEGLVRQNVFVLFFFLPLADSTLFIFETSVHTFYDAVTFFVVVVSLIANQSHFLLFM